jgi:hepatocyte growth factor-regulated tyrosine kinase substrate
LATPDNRHRRSSHGPSHLEHRPARDLTDADLQRAIQLSLEEVGAQGQHRRPGYVPHQPDSWQRSEPPLVENASRPSAQVDDDDDSDLKAAIEASLREANAPKPSAPTGPETPKAEGPPISYTGSSSQSYFPAASAQPSLPTLPNHDLAPLESDTIITFSQTIEQVQAQGGRDVSRFPAVTQLFDNANNLRPKLARSLDDTGRKEGTLTLVYCLIAFHPSTVPSELLTEMNDKLAQAVKLYDHILTQQVSRPIWRQQTASPPAQPLNQWNYVQSPTSTRPNHTPMAEPWHQPSSTYTSPQTYQPPASDGPSHVPPSHSPPQTWIQPSHVPSVAGPPPIDSSQANPQYHSVPTTQPSVSLQYQYARAVQPVSIQQPHPPVPAPAQVITSPQQPAPIATHSTPIHHHMSSPPSAQHRQQSLPQPQQPLSRHNTVTHAAQASPAPSQQQYSPIPAIGLPNFPSVPTAPPSIPYGSYESTSSVVEQPKKEALLIEL